ncbi:hypothetical protein NDA16_001940 [Ustilago loliicola]|nr:hypothetical protein NDA16_001940 [Ustilago loliicola]
MSATTTQPVTAGGTSSSTSASASASASTQSHNDPATQTTTATTGTAVQPPDISSPHQLIDWVDTVLGQLETRFDDMNGQVTARNLIHGTLSPVTGTGTNADP